MAKLKPGKHVGKTLSEMETNGLLAKLRAKLAPQLPETIKCVGGCGKIFMVADLPNHYKHYNKVNRAM